MLEEDILDMISAQYPIGVDNEEIFNCIPSESSDEEDIQKNTPHASSSTNFKPEGQMKAQKTHLGEKTHLGSNNSPQSAIRKKKLLKEEDKKFFENIEGKKTSPVNVVDSNLDSNGKSNRNFDKVPVWPVRNLKDEKEDERYENVGSSFLKSKETVSSKLTPKENLETSKGKSFLALRRNPRIQAFKPNGSLKNAKHFEKDSKSRLKGGQDNTLIDSCPSSSGQKRNNLSQISIDQQSFSSNRPECGIDPNLGCTCNLAEGEIPAVLPNPCTCGEMQASRHSSIPNVPRARAGKNDEEETQATNSVPFLRNFLQKIRNRTNTQARTIQELYPKEFVRKKNWVDVSQTTK